MRQIALAASVGAVVSCLILIVSDRRDRGSNGVRVDEEPSTIREIELLEPVPGDILMRRRTYEVQAIEPAGEEDTLLATATHDTRRITLRGRGKSVMLLVRPVENRTYPYPSD